MIGLKRIPSREGGVEIHVEELSKRLVSMGHEIHVYCRKSPTLLKEYTGIKLVYIPTFKCKGLETLVYSFLATLQAVRRRYDIIHFHALGPSTMAWIPRLLGYKVITTVHGLDWQRAKWSGVAKTYLKIGEYAAAKFAHATFVLSENNKRYFESKYHNKVVKMINGVDMPNSLTANIIREKYGLEKDSYILFLGRLVPEKGLHYLIEAYHRLNTSYKLVIAGASSYSDEYVDSIRHMVESNDHIIMTGFVEGEELAELYSNAYIYVLPSDIEGLSIGLLEALSYGNCCLVSNIPENVEVVMDNGLSFKSGNCDDLAEKLEYLLTNPQEVQQFRRLACKHVLSHYSWDEAAGKTEEVYRHLSNSRI